MLEWATTQIQKDTETEAEDFLSKFDIMKPWLDLQLWNHIKKQEDVKEEKKAVVAKALGISSSKINVKNSFEDKMKDLGLSQNTLDEILGKSDNG